MIDGENEWTQSIRKQIKRLTSLTEKLVYLSRMDEDGYDQAIFSKSEVAVTHDGNSDQFGTVTVKVPVKVPSLSIVLSPRMRI